MTNAIHAIHTEHAPKAIGPYSQAVAAGPYLHLSGQIPIDPKVGEITATTIEEQTRQVFENIQAVLAADGLSLKDVVSTVVYLKDLKKDFVAMNTVYAEYFDQPVKPARTTIQAGELPKDALIEITCVALRNMSRL